MNERIKQLIAECTHTVTDYSMGIDSSHEDFDKEKFALLIVRECLTFVEPIPGSGDIDDLALEAAHDGIKEHFGIEE